MEVKVAMALIKHDVLFALSDTASPLIKNTFDDSKIANAYVAAKTKMICCIPNRSLKEYYK